MEYDALEPQFPYTYASWGRRIASAVVDHLVVSISSVPFMVGAFSDFSDALDRNEAIPNEAVRTILVTYLVIVVLYTTVMHAWRGSTIGKMVAGTVLVTEEGNPVSAGTAFVRAVSFACIYFVSLFLIVPFVVSELRPLWNRQKQTWHDSIARTIVVLRQPAG